MNVREPSHRIGEPCIWLHLGFEAWEFAPC